MARHLKRLKPFTPRRKRKGVKLDKQQLHDLSHLIRSDVGAFIVLLKEGNSGQAIEAQQKAKNDFLKHSDEMKKIAEKIGDHVAKIVKDFLQGVDEVIHSSVDCIDEAKILHCYQTSDLLEKELKTAA